jgi:hypothetical protein
VISGRDSYKSRSANGISDRGHLMWECPPCVSIGDHHRAKSGIGSSDRHLHMAKSANGTSARRRHMWRSPLATPKLELCVLRSRAGTLRRFWAGASRPRGIDRFETARSHFAPAPSDPRLPDGGPTSPCSIRERSIGESVNVVARQGRGWCSHLHDVGNKLPATCVLWLPRHLRETGRAEGDLCAP